jgi:hypothetical protein
MRIAATILLLFMAIDLCSICTCEDELADFAGSSAQHITGGALSAGIDIVDFTHECFCCCRHVQQEEIVHILITLPLCERTHSVQASYVHLETAIPFHPPRLIPL